MSDQEKPRLPSTTAIGDKPSFAGSPTPDLSNTKEDGAVKLFHSVSLFSTLDSAQVMEVMRLCTIETYAAGDVLCRQDDAADAMYVIERGEVAVSQRSGGEDVRVAYLGDGAVVGEMALIFSQPRSATIEAVSETRVYRLEGRDMEALRLKRSVTAYKILFQLLKTLGDRSHKLQARIQDIFANPEEHIESFTRQTRELAQSLNRALED
jgi:CRP-like cAMP-binding protein